MISFKGNLLMIQIQEKSLNAEMDDTGEKWWHRGLTLQKSDEIYIPVV